jgi:hypothetical protein
MATEKSPTKEEALEALRKKGINNLEDLVDAMIPETGGYEQATMSRLWSLDCFDWLWRTPGHMDGDLMTIMVGQYSGRKGTVESNVFERIVDHADDWANCYQAMLDSGDMVTVGWDQVEAAK